jgi:hypothetical protein
MVFSPHLLCSGGVDTEIFNCPLFPHPFRVTIDTPYSIEPLLSLTCLEIKTKVYLYLALYLSLVP